MVSLTFQEIAHYRSQLVQFPEALEALDAIEDCEGDLEDAALSLAIHAGQQPDRNDWLVGLAKRCRVALCRSPTRDALQNGNLTSAIAFLLEETVCPPLLITPVILYVLKVGLEDFCKPLNEKIF
jgi:hypothetical protein